MAYANLVMENERTGQIKYVPVGFSWTVLFFGFFPPLFRSDWKWFSIIGICFFLTSGLSDLVFAFLYNKSYIKDLINNGFKVKDVQYSSIEEIERRIGFKLPTTQTC